MSKTVRNQPTQQFESDGFRPEWQENRGKRYGNQRKQVAALKVRQRRMDRAKEKAGFDFYNF